MPSLCAPAKVTVSPLPIASGTIAAWAGFGIVDQQFVVVDGCGNPENYLDGLSGKFRVFTPGTDATLFTVDVTFTGNACVLNVAGSDITPIGFYSYSLSYSDETYGDVILGSPGQFNVGDGGPTP